MNKYAILKISLVLCFLGVILTTIASCAREAVRVSYNVSKEADNFNVLRRLAVINTRTDKVEFEVVGRFSLDTNASNNQKIYIIVEKEKGVYLKHIIGLNENTFYVVEDIGGANVSEYKYEVNYIPEMIVPVKVTSNK